MGIAADDQLVVNALRTSFLVPPSVKPYNLVHNSSYNPSIGQGQIVDTLLSQKVCAVNLDDLLLIHAYLILHR